MATPTAFTGDTESSTHGPSGRDWAGLALCILIALIPAIIVGVATSDCSAQSDCMTGQSCVDGICR